MKSIVVFGGSGGLGTQVCEILEQNYKVFQLSSADVDVTNYDQVYAWFSKNDIDIVLNLSGKNYDSFMHKYSADNASQINDLIDVNIKGATNIIRACLPQMRVKGYGRIILISSILADAPVVSTGVYAGTKGFLDSLAKTVALENAGKGITCNTLQLGYFDGGLTYEIPEQFRNNIKNEIPMKRFGTIQELADTIEFLIKVEYITGTNIKVNGGKDF